MDPRKVKFVQKMKEEMGEVIEPKRYYHVAKLKRNTDGSLSPERRLSRGRGGGTPTFFLHPCP